ncbi:MBOAT family protein [Alkalihalobacillus hwajinpoensis]|uniref:MBOAT family O-acyltransferase n=1 Tax=Guptibacillus hwajinpoensis TaxID=208199 RepID=UPI00188418C2|nr:MBOAT family protein [Pseudalkalibacillus hwajinpoensis]MBF0705549.1 MBOAT family protein [Pseudalkalibacillus hwajinpoensis]
MVFSNLVFLFAFMPIVLFSYFFARKSFRNIVLLIASLVFYAWGEPQYVFLMLFSIIMNYGFGRGIDHFHNQLVTKKLLLTLSIVGNIAILGYFKYAGFVLANVNGSFGTSFALGELPLPIGISFFTFQAMSYVIDIYRKDAPVQKNVFSLALYISLFPQLVAGPIVRYNTVDQQIHSRSITADKVHEGIKRFIIGLSKKVLLANSFAVVADQAFNTPAGEMSVMMAWIGVIAYTLQIYFDFSGYSDMAIGLGKMFGFDFLENFRYPYISKSISEFWRRWHISLGTWFKDYVYIPLGGNRHGKLVQVRNLLIVWTITGFWHGASWTFMAWGFYYGAIIVIESLGFSKWLSRLWSPLQHIYVLLLVMIGWVFFRADNFTYSFEYLQTMFGFNQAAFADSMFLLQWNDNWVLFLAGVIFSTPFIANIGNIYNRMATKAKGLQVVTLFSEPAIYMTLMVFAMVRLVNSSYNPFIYFRF